MRQLRMGVNTMSCTDTYHLTTIAMIDNCDQCELDEKF